MGQRTGGTSVGLAVCDVEAVRQERLRQEPIHDADTRVVRVYADVRQAPHVCRARGGGEIGERLRRLFTRLVSVSIEQAVQVCVRTPCIVNGWWSVSKLAADERAIKILSEAGEEAVAKHS
eukprot:6181622-Pleurochrysis_carterae.AAC.1